VTVTTNLTIPLYDHMPVGNVWAWDVPFQTQEITSYDSTACRLFQITMHNETGTRLMWAAVHYADAPLLEDLDLGQFVNRPASVVKIEKGPFGEITRADVEKAFAEATHVQEGDAILLYTTWGDDRRWKKIGDDYARQSPHWGYDGATATVECMKQIRSNWLVTDCAYIGNTGEGHMREQWANRPAWERPRHICVSTRGRCIGMISAPQKRSWMTSS